MYSICLILYATLSIDMPCKVLSVNLDLYRRLDPSLTCSEHCSCDPTAFTPICGSDGRNYFSPCYAGCQLDTINNSKIVRPTCY